MFLAPSVSILLVFFQCFRFHVCHVSWFSQCFRFPVSILLVFLMFSGLCVCVCVSVSFCLFFQCLGFLCAAFIGFSNVLRSLGISADSSAKVLKPILIENFLCFRCFGKFSLSHLESLAERTELELCAMTLNAPRCRCASEGHHMHACNML